MSHVLLDKWSFHFWCGVENKYPLCCIIWFCNTITNFGEQDDSLFEKIFSEHFDNLTGKQSDFSDRNLCPNCTWQRLIILFVDGNAH